MDTLVTHVIGAVALVLVASWLLGAAAQWCGQPRVVGQILAGILFGPSLLGRLPWHLANHLFPRSVLPAMVILAQIAIVLFMFSVGYELDLRSLRERRRAVPFVAAAALFVPMALGAGAALTFGPGFSALGQPHITQSFVLFMGVAMSITALPVLAAIVRDCGLAGTSAGITATTAAGVMDVAAWLTLAVALVGSTHKPGMPALLALPLVSGFAAVMLLAVRPALRWWFSRRRFLLANPLPVALMLALGSAWVTASLGLHPVFGGFLAGLTMPRTEGAPDAEVLRPMEEVGGLLLPLFFVVTGLSLNIGALNAGGFAILALLCVIAIAGKLGPGYLASRLGGLRPREAATVAVLVSTRGLTELIALNVGLSAGLIGQRLFSVFVLMALITTALTAPLLSLKCVAGPQLSPGARPRWRRISPALASPDEPAHDMIGQADLRASEESGPRGQH
jgi:K+:H+ antiporter